MSDIKENIEPNKFEQSLINGLAKEVLTEQRRNRRWGIFLKYC